MAVSACHGTVESVVATANLSNKRFVSFAGAVPSANTKTYGVCIADTDSGNVAPVVIDGTVEIEAGGAISVGGAVTTDASGKAVAAGANPVNGYAVTEASGNGVFIKIKLA